MPWCPKCKEEYREGVTVCAECGETLVESLDEETLKEGDYEEAAAKEEADEEETVADTEEMDDDEPADYDWDAEKSAAEKDEDIQSEEMADQEETGVLQGAGNTTYVKKADEYKDLVGTGYTFVILSVLGLIYLALCQLKVIPISYNVLALIVLTAMFVIFIIIGISSFVKAKGIKAMIGSEEEESKNILSWLREHAAADRLEAMKGEEESEEEYYLNLTEQLKGELKEEYPEAEDSYLEMLIEEYYSEVFEES